ncbi:MAG: hypothetical protein GC187_03300 [Alphaproteobacteria bacterium]|nr:hypothetical protein [Alphaproteobacteria bacterium]
MPRRHDISRPRDGLIRIEVYGERDPGQAQVTIAAFLDIQNANPSSQILFDVTQATYSGAPEALYGRARQCAQGMTPCKVAILAERLDSEFARFWRRGLIESGHETAVFVCEQEADAWLASGSDTDILFLA